MKTMQQQRWQHPASAAGREFLERGDAVVVAAAAAGFQHAAAAAEH